MSLYSDLSEVLTPYANKINELNGSLDDALYYHGTGINRCDYDAFTLDKYMQDGVIKNSTNYCLSDYCFVGDFKNKFIFRGHNPTTDATNSLTGIYWVTAFTKNKEYIGTIGNASGQYTKPDNCVYVRFTLTKSIYQENDNIILEEIVGSVMNPNNNLYSPPSYFIRPNRYLEWSNFKWTCVGDSLTERNARTTKAYYDYIAFSTGITVYNMGKSATGYHRGDNFYSRIENVPTDSDVVTFFGSFNDLGDNYPLGTVDDTELTTVAGYINATFDRLNSILPMVPFGVITPTPWNSANPYTGTESGNANLYVNLLIGICKKRGIPILDLYHNSLLRVWDSNFRQYAFSKDSEGAMVHPDENGHKLIAPRIKAFLDTLIMPYGVETIT